MSRTRSCCGVVKYALSWAAGLAVLGLLAGSAAWAANPVQPTQASDTASAAPSGQAAASGAAGQPMAGQAVTVRLRDVARLLEVRDNQLVGVGLVTGLSGTGDSTGVSSQMLANLLSNQDINVSPTAVRGRNVAVVVVTANLPSFSRIGDRIDVTVTSAGDARSLVGGVLISTLLRGPDDQIYAVAQGPLITGAISAGGPGGASLQRNVATVGRIPGGATVEREIPIQLGNGSTLTWVLQDPDFATAVRAAEAINSRLGQGLARARDDRSIVVSVPESQQGGNLADFVAAMGDVPVTPDVPARVVVDERTGTVVIGERVRIAPVAVAHGSLTVQVEPNYQVSQPPPLAPKGSQTVVVPGSRVQATEQPASIFTLPGSATVQDLVGALNAVGASPRDIVVILQAIKEAGALYGELVVQ